MPQKVVVGTCALIDTPGEFKKLLVLVGVVVPSFWDAVGGVCGNPE